MFGFKINSKGKRVRGRKTQRAASNSTTRASPLSLTEVVFLKPKLAQVPVKSAFHLYAVLEAKSHKKSIVEADQFKAGRCFALTNLLFDAGLGLGLRLRGKPFASQSNKITVTWFDKNWRRKANKTAGRKRQYCSSAGGRMLLLAAKQSQVQRR